MQEVRQKAFCPHCGNVAPQRLIHRQEHSESGYESEGSDPARRTEVPWGTFVAVCETCERILLYNNPFRGMPANHFASGELIFPESGELHKAVPEAIRAVYSEAWRIKEIAPNAFATQIRRALEAVCEDRQTARGALAVRLEQLADKGELPPNLVEVAGVIRLLGNIGAHAAERQVHPLHVQALDDFFRAVVEYVYVAPSKLRVFRETMEEAERQVEESE